MITLIERQLINIRLSYSLITSRLKENHHVYVLCSNLVKYQCQGQNTSIPICRDIGRHNCHRYNISRKKMECKGMWRTP